MKYLIFILKFPIRLILTILLLPMLVMWVFLDIATSGENWSSFDLLKDLWLRKERKLSPF